MKTVGASGARIGLIISLSLILVILFSSIAMATTINSYFKCKNTNAATTFYSYLREPELQDSGYARGLKTGTMNYFNGTGEATLEDTVIYYDGKVDPAHPSELDIDHNSTLLHTLNVDFVSDEKDGSGISEFYAKGFYSNNRAVSAWKKVWFDKRHDLPSNSIIVEATADLRMKGVYDLRYNVSADNAYFVFKDAAGWSNRTGSRRVDWEQEGLMKGEQIQVTNDLVASDLWISRAGFGDWLPCCMVDGEIPPVEPIDSEWPSAGVYAMIQPKNIKLNCANGICTPNCTYGCDGVQCIYTTGEASGSYTTGEAPGSFGAIPIFQRDMPDVQVESFYKTVEGVDNITEFTTYVSNLGSVAVTDVQLADLLPDNANYVPGSATINGQHADTSIKGNQLAWRIGDLLAVSGPDGVRMVKYLVNTASMSDLADLDNNSVYAGYYIGSRYASTTAVNSSEILKHQAD
jgi:uncharacterized repeat protein (TIGR01451 family)